MAVYTNHVRSRSTGFDRFNPNEYENDVPLSKDSLPNILPEVP